MKHGQRAHCVILCRDPGAGESLPQQDHAGSGLAGMLAQWQGVARVRMGALDEMLLSEPHAIVRELLLERQQMFSQDEALLLVVCSADRLCNVLAVTLQCGCSHYSPLGYLPPAASPG